MKRYRRKQLLSVNKKKAGNRTSGYALNERGRGEQIG